MTPLNVKLHLQWQAQWRNCDAEVEASYEWGKVDSTRSENQMITQKRIKHYT